MNESRARTNKRTWLVFAGIFALVILAMLLRSSKHEVPDRLLGAWHTSDANYADRFIEITEVSISFTTGEGTASTGVIKEVRMVPEGDRALYTVVYDADGTRNEVSFYFEVTPTSGNIIRLKNQQNIVWTKNEST